MAKEAKSKKFDSGTITLPKELKRSIKKRVERSAEFTTMCQYVRRLLVKDLEK